MEHARLGNPVHGQLTHPSPSHAAGVAAVPQGPSPKPRHPCPEHTKAAEALRCRVVVEVVLHDRLEPKPCLRHRVVIRARSCCLFCSGLARMRRPTVFRFTVKRLLFT